MLWNGRRKRAQGPSYFFEGEYSPYAYSSLSLLKQLLRERRARGIERPDAEIAREVRERLAAEAPLTAAAIEVHCAFGRVILRGTVGGHGTKRWAGEVACTVPGVVDLSNQLVIEERRRLAG